MVDTVGDFEVALRLALADLGWPPVGRDFISRTVGKGSEYLLRRTLEQVGAPPELYDGPGCATSTTTSSINGEHSAVYPGVVEGLQALRARGLRLACLTNKPNAFARAAAGHEGPGRVLRRTPSAATRSRARSPIRCRWWRPARRWAATRRAR